MIYVIYVFAALFIALGAAMLYIFHRERHFGMFLMGVTYATTGLMAFGVSHWWPLVAGFVLVWMLKMLGLEMGYGGNAEGENNAAGEESQTSKGEEARK